MIRVVGQHHRSRDNAAWCEVCAAEWPYARTRYGPTAAARRHTAMTGHRTTVDRTSGVQFVRVTP